MKYIRYQHEEAIHYGAIDGSVITKLDGPYIGREAERTNIKHRLEEVKVLAPVEPKQVVGIGLNYSLHAKERGKALPEEPMMFMVSPSAIIGQGEEIVLPTDHQIEYEAELAVVIGKEARHLTREEALSYVFGYTCANDVSDRDLQKKDGQFTRAKSFATFKPLGPAIETELNPNDTGITLMQNGITRQHSRTSDLIHDVKEILVKVTEVMTLYPGDVILTGTPEGVGPLAAGDRVEIEVEGIGKLVNDVRK